MVALYQGRQLVQLEKILDQKSLAQSEATYKAEICLIRGFLDQQSYPPLYME